MAERPLVTRTSLLAVGSLLTIAVASAFVGHALGAYGGNVPDAQLVAARELRFIDRDDGAVVVEAGRDRHEIAVFSGEQGFLRGTMRGFVRTRHLAEVGDEQPFRLSRWSDGRLTLDDPATGQHVELLAFGPTNAGVFAPLMDSN